MPLRYDCPPATELRQGEILADLVEHAANVPTMTLADDVEVVVEPFPHALVVILTADCDLAQQCAARAAGGDRPRGMHVLLCDAFIEEELRDRMAQKGRDEWRRIRQQQDERYHCLAAAAVGDPPIEELPPLFLDFKRHFTVPTEHLCAAIDAGGVRRRAVIPTMYVHQLMHRFYGFLSRVGVE